ncbi:MAG TPA: dienelactone hydrolase family protein [Pseudoneobacillus sp.]|nr:dienelactone hydrolase family protein [Pseudoneobacillus sp.]
MKVGRIIKEIIDYEREETLSHVNEKRKFMISLFYQADPYWQTEQIPFFIDLFSPYNTETLQIFKEMGLEENYLVNHKTFCYNNAPISLTMENSPIIIYSPGMGVDRDLYLYNITKLVQAGYMVITVGVTYETMVTVFPGKGIVQQSDIVRNMSGMDFTSLKRLVEVRIEDITTVINTLLNWNETDSYFKGKFDLNRIGVIGHSLGGTTIFELASKDERIKAGVILDGSLFLISDVKNVHTPILSIRQHHSSYQQMKEIWDAESAELFSKGQQSLWDSLRGIKYFMKINQSNHISFTDAPIFMNKKNDIVESVGRIHHTINDFTIAFFNELLERKSHDFSQMINNKSHGKGFYLIDREGEIIA